MPDPIYIAGPTATGKSAIALLLAQQLDGEIISVDSMQVYRGMDLGTAKPSPLERKRVSHHLVDILEPDQTFDAARFATLARAAQEEVQRRGHLPIFCGGTGLYFNALLAGVGDAPPSDPKLRAELEAAPLPTLLRELELADPALFSKIDHCNPRRIVRAIEVIRLTGKAYSTQRSDWSSGPDAGRCFGLRRERAELNERIDRRVEAMFAAGLVAETRALLERGLEKNRTAMQAIGYRQVVEHLRGERALEATIALVKQKTRQYAKRQMTWFRKQLSLEWIDLTGLSPEAGAAVILQRLSLRPV